MNLSLGELFEKAYRQRRLLYVLLELTYGCNFACRFCYNPVFRKGQARKASEEIPQQPLTLEEYAGLLDKLKKGGVLFLTLSGGEPLMHHHFWEILEEAKRQSFGIRLFTNGSLINEKNAERIHKIGVFCVEISIYGADEECYDEVTGRGEDFGKVVEAVKLLKKYGIMVYLKCILTKFTEKQTDKIQDLADELGVILRWDPVLSPSEDGLDYPLMYRASNEGLEKLLTGPKFKVGSSPFDRGEGDSICTIGRVSVNIDPFGNINPCAQWKESLGNIRKNDIFDIWENSERLKEIIAISEMVPKELKKITDAHSYCFQCIGRSRLIFGDPLIPDPCELKIAEIKKAMAEKKN
jgi:radical SAM protein with 4Fe4S-binding SPASM domain